MNGRDRRLQCLENRGPVGVGELVDVHDAAIKLILGCSAVGLQTGGEEDVDGARVGVGAVATQHFRHLDRALPEGQLVRRPAVRTGRVRVGAVFQQQVDQLDGAAGSDSGVRGWPGRIIGILCAVELGRRQSVGVGAGLQGQAYPLDVAGADRS